MNAGGSDGRSDGFHQQLLQILANKGPSLLQDLHERTHGLSIFFVCRFENGNDEIRCLVTYMIHEMV